MLTSDVLRARAWVDAASKSIAVGRSDLAIGNLSDLYALLTTQLQRNIIGLINPMANSLKTGSKITRKPSKMMTNAGGGKAKPSKKGKKK